MWSPRKEEKGALLLHSGTFEDISGQHRQPSDRPESISRCLKVFFLSLNSLAASQLTND